MTKMKLIKNVFVFWIMFLLFASLVVIIPPQNNCTPSATPTKWVDDDWTGQPSVPTGWTWGTDAFGTANGIIAALTAAVSTDYIYVYEGSYAGGFTISVSDILLRGEDRDDTIIDAGGNSIVVRITANDVSIDKFTVQNSGAFSGIFLNGAPGSPPTYVNGCTISNINCEDNTNGIKLYYAGEDSSNYNTFQNIYCNIEDHYQDDNSILLEKEANYNQFSDCYIFQSQDDGGDGAVIIYESDNNTFTNIEISGNDGDGFYLVYDSDDNQIYSCEIQNTENGISLHGSGTNECNDNIIYYCDIDSNEDSCIYIDTCDGNTIEHNNLGASGDSADYVIQLISSSVILINYNVIKAANVGISIESGSDSNPINNNEISYCVSYGIEISSSYSNEIHHNNFIDNNGAGESWNPAYIQAYDDVEPPDDVNSWDNGYPDPAIRSLDLDIDGGNYWSDWGPVGSDEYSGPNQDVEGSDGIVDGVYDIDSIYSDDFYPLKEPVEF